MFFNSSKYTLSKVGRYRINKRLGLKIKEDNTVLTKEDVVGVIDELLKIYVEKTLPQIRANIC